MHNHSKSIPNIIYTAAAMTKDRQKLLINTIESQHICLVKFGILFLHLSFHLIYSYVFFDNCFLTIDINKMDDLDDIKDSIKQVETQMEKQYIKYN
jgi:hypothetical protein